MYFCYIPEVIYLMTFMYLNKELGIESDITALEYCVFYRHFDAVVVQPPSDQTIRERANKERY